MYNEAFENGLVPGVDYPVVEDLVKTSSWRDRWAAQQAKEQAQILEQASQDLEKEKMRQEILQELQEQGKLVSTQPKQSTWSRYLPQDFNDLLKCAGVALAFSKLAFEVKKYKENKKK